MEETKRREADQSAEQQKLLAERLNLVDAATRNDMLTGMMGWLSGYQAGHENANTSNR